MPPKAVEFSPRAERQLAHIHDWYRDNAGPAVATEAIAAILGAAERLGALPATFRPAARAGLREYILERFPYLLLHRMSAHRVQIIAILHQSRKR